MKNIILSLIACIFVTSLVFAVGPDSSITEGINKPDTGQLKTDTQLETQNQGENAKAQVRNKIQSGNITIQNGKRLRIQIQDNNQIQLEVGNSRARTSLNITREETETGTKLETKLSNGKNTEIKIMPNVASEKAIEQLRLNNCKPEEGCSIELKEVGKEEQTKVAYEIKSQKQSKILGLFKARMQVQAQVDANTGEVIQSKKPWWAFLAIEAEE